MHLDENFRATGRLVDLANALSAGVAYGRRLRTANPMGEAARLHIASDEQAEADFVATEIARLCAAGRVRHPGEVAVLHRTNRLAQRVALALREHRLPYRIGGADLFGRREVRDALAYLRLAHNPGDAAALTRIADVPPRRLERVAHALRDLPVPVRGLPNLARGYGPAAAESARALVAIVDDLHARSADLGPGPLLDLALERSGYRAWLAERADGAARLEHLGALRSLALQARSGLGGWLAEVQMGEDVTPGLEDAERVLLTTIHGAKGLEWRVVFVVGFEEGILPHRRALVPDPDGRHPPGLEEELRLAYVAVSRPRELLYLTCCRTRRRGERSESRLPSRFLRGLPVERIDRAA